MERQSWYATSENSDPYAQTWTPEQQTRKRLNDAQIKRDNLEASFFSMPTTKEVVKLGEYDDEIKRLTQQLGIGDRTSMQNVAAPMSAPEQGGYSGDNSGYANVGSGSIYDSVGNYASPMSAPESSVNADPYATTWTQEQETRKRLQDTQIMRENLLAANVGMPTTADIVKMGEYDDVIKRLTQELGLGPQEYTAGVEGGWQEETKPAPYTPGVEGGDIGVDALQGLHYGGSMLDEEEDGGKEERVEVSIDAIDEQLKELFPDTYANGSVTLSNIPPFTREVSEAMAKITNVGRSIIYDLPFYLVAGGIAGASKLFKVGKHVTSNAKAISEFLKYGSSFVVGEIGSSILEEFVDIPKELQGKTTTYYVSAEFEDGPYDLMFFEVDVHESGRILVSYLNPAK